MPKIDNTEYEAAEIKKGEYQRPPAGGYICRIQAVRTTGEWDGNPIDYVADKQYVKLIWDIDEGDFAGYYSEDYWNDESKDWGHQFFMSWRNLGAFKYTIQCLDESNPGFDAKAAFDADKWNMFIGKRMGLVLGEEEYEANDGSVKIRHTKFPRIKSVREIQDGKFKVPEFKRLEGSSTYAEPVSPGGKSVYDEDLPF